MQTSKDGHGDSITQDNGPSCKWVTWLDETETSSLHVGELPQNRPTDKSKEDLDKRSFVFICHTGRDGVKDEIARPIYWFLQYVLRVPAFLDEVQQGTSGCGQEFARAAYKCSHAIVVLSPAFRKRKCCVQELNTFLRRKQNDPHGFKLLPVLRWDVKDVKDYESDILNNTAMIRLETAADLAKILWPALIRALGLESRSTQELECHFKSYVEIMREKRAVPRSLEAAVKEEPEATPIGNIANKVFVSYTGRDVSVHDFVTTLTNKLHEQNIAFFHGKDFVPMERPWSDYIRTNAKICRIFIAVLSPLYFTRYWCMQELYISMTHGHTVIPVYYGNYGVEDFPRDRTQFVRALENDKRIQDKELGAWWNCVVKLRKLTAVQVPQILDDMEERDAQLVRCVIEAIKRYMNVDHVSAQGLVRNDENAGSTNENRVLRASIVNTSMRWSSNPITGESGSDGKRSVGTQPFLSKDEAEEEEDDDDDFFLHRALGRIHLTKESLDDYIEAHPDTLYLDDNEGRLPIHVACMHQTSVGVVAKLAKKWRSSLAFPAKNGMLPLHEACMNKHDRKGGIVKALVGMFPKTAQVQDKMGRLPLHIAAIFGASLDVFRALIDHQGGNASELFVGDHDGMLPLQLACVSGAPKESQVFICEKMLEHCNSDKFETMSCMAAFLRGQGNYKEAERIQRSLAARMDQEANIVHDRDSLMSVLNNLAITLCNQGKNKEAESLFETVLKRKIEVLGRKHGDTLYAMANLAVVLYNQGNYNKAAVLHRAILGN